jgi:hypothetical protein
MLVGLGSSNKGIKLTPLSNNITYIMSILRANWNRTKLGFSSSKLVELIVLTSA